MTEFTAYEKRRAIDHERQWRALLSHLDIVCWRRKCRRDGVCTGPMLDAPCLAAQMKAQQALGLSGRACAKLPLCVASASPRDFAELESLMDTFHQGLIDGTGFRLLRLDRCRPHAPDP